MISIIKAVIIGLSICLLIEPSLSNILFKIDPEFLSNVTLPNIPIEFSLKLLKQIELSNKQNNVVISPTSIHSLYLMVYLLAENDTPEKKQLCQLLQLPNDNYVSNFLSHALLMQLYNSLNGIKLMNKIYYDSHIKPYPLLQEIFANELEDKNFRNHLDDSVKLINQWIRSSTLDTIQEKVDEISLNQNLNVLQLNLFHFRGNWEIPFMKRYTSPGIFTDENGQKHTVEMMLKRCKDIYFWSEELESKFIKINNDNDILMFIILPEKNEPGLISNIIDRIKKETLEKILPTNEAIEFDLLLPKFSMMNKFHYEEILPYSNLTNLKSMKLRLSEKNCNLTINEGIHIAKIVVEEYGTKNVKMPIKRGDIDKEEVIKCNRPFIYLIYDKNLNSIILEGIYRKP